MTEFKQALLKKTILLPDIDWVEIPSGEFIYGENESQQTLTLEKFYISRYPITNIQYQSFVDAGGYQDKRWWQGLKVPDLIELSGLHPNRPRDRLNWYEAVAFTRWLSKQLDLEIFLPTEQQWEKAARGTDGREYPWGEKYQPGFANIFDLSAGKQNLQELAAVGLFMQGVSPYGVLDMAGNSWEWCLNNYDSPKEKGSDSHIVRGGSWKHASVSARCAHRFSNNPDYRGNFGLRVVCLSPDIKH